LRFWYITIAMLTFKTKAEVKDYLLSLPHSGQSIGFVPTMGALHQGHLALVHRALAENDITVCSIFVNPTQFTNANDLATYPRTVEQDLALLAKQGCHIAYLPEVEDLYPQGREVETFDFGALEHVMEGKYRKGHFQGMATVVKRLLLAVQPSKAYFGKKDYQQWLIVKRLTELANINTEIIGCPIEREADGLALSSRNLRLTPQQRHAAPVIFEALTQLSQSNRDKALTKAIAKAIETINAHPDLAVEYLEAADAQTLQPVTNWNDAGEIRAFAAVYAGDVRLIDNVSLS
jgi:pantoate--beta-alanine ligase